MDFDAPGWPMIDDYFRQLGTGRSPQTCRRYARVRLRLYDFLDVDDMAAWLGPDDATLLAAEREFQRDGAVRSVLGTEGLLRCLRGFVSDELLPTTDTEARMQASVVDRLLDHLRRSGLLDQPPGRAFGEAKSAVTRARLSISTRHKPAVAVDLHTMDGRFRQQPGPQW